MPCWGQSQTIPFPKWIITLITVAEHLTCIATSWLKHVEISKTKKTRAVHSEDVHFHVEGNTLVTAIGIFIARRGCRCRPGPASRQLKSSVDVGWVCSSMVQLCSVLFSKDF